MHNCDFRYGEILRSIAVFLCLLIFPSAVVAQAELGCIANINVSLNESCEALIVPSMVLAGDLTEIDTLNLSILVEDANPVNGAVVDGCGVYTVSVERLDQDPNMRRSMALPCWSTLRAEDKTPPRVTQQVAPIELLCVDLPTNRVDVLPETVDRCFRVVGATGEVIPGSMAAGLQAALQPLVGIGEVVVPRFYDACADVLEVCVRDELSFSADEPTCEDIVLTRTFTAREIVDCDNEVEAENATAESSYVITFQRPDLDDLSTENIAASVVYNRCGLTNGSLEQIRGDYPEPRAEDFPYLVVGDRIISLLEDDPVCNLSVSYSDGEPLVTCDYVYKFVRTYTLIDWCEPDSIVRFSQIVKVGDDDPPLFFGPVQDRDFDGIVDEGLIYPTNAGVECGAYLILDAPGVRVSDDCSAVISLTAQIYQEGNFELPVIGTFPV
ncbi:MAG: hypothetical protein AAF597_05130, partial [Bacteroidota bacterium]